MKKLVIFLGVIALTLLNGCVSSKFIYTGRHIMTCKPKVYLDISNAWGKDIIKDGFAILDSQDFLEWVNQKREADWIIKWETWKGARSLADFNSLIWGEEVSESYLYFLDPSKTAWGKHNKVKFMFLETGSFNEKNVIIVTRLCDKDEKLLASKTDEENAKGVANFVREIFQKIDGNPPSLYLNQSFSNKKSVKTTISNIHISFIAIDNLGIRNVSILRGGEELQRFTPGSPAKELKNVIAVPLEFGENRIRIIAYDWCMLKTEENIQIIRTKSEGIITSVSDSPQLIFIVSALDDDNSIVGGREEGIGVVVRNQGKGIAEDVKVILSGDETLVQHFGYEKIIGDIGPGEEKDAFFGAVMPTELPRKEATIHISLSESRGYSPTYRASMTFALVPAEMEERYVETIEDVDNLLPKRWIDRENGYALIIGLSKYQNVPAPKYAKNDAEVFSKYALRVFGISNIKTIYDERATCSTIKANLTDWLRKKKGFKVIYFAGHGVPDPENPREGDVYLLPYDGDPELKSTLISLQEIAQLGEVEGDTVLLFLDACFSGGEGRTIELASRPLVVASISETNAITFAAAEGTQPSKEFEKAKHGYFTYYLLLGLKVHADVDGDGWITTIELYDFVKKKVADATNNVQIPVLRPVRNIRIGRVK